MFAGKKLGETLGVKRRGVQLVKRGNTILTRDRDRVRRALLGPSNLGMLVLSVVQVTAAQQVLFPVMHVAKENTPLPLEAPIVQTVLPENTGVAQGGLVVNIVVLGRTVQAPDKDRATHARIQKLRHIRGPAAQITVCVSLDSPRFQAGVSATQASVSVETHV